MDCLGLIAAVLAGFHSALKFVAGKLTRIDPPHGKTRLKHPFRWSPDNVHDNRRLFRDCYRFQKRDPGKELRTPAWAVSTSVLRVDSRRIMRPCLGPVILGVRSGRSELGIVKLALACPGKHAEQ